MANRGLNRWLAAGRVSRRTFVMQTTGAGAVLATLPTANAEGSWSPTLFFSFPKLRSDRNLSLVVGGRRYRLTRTVENPSVLARARVTNKFLAGVPTELVTHHLQGLVLATDICSLAYTHSPIEHSQGTWEMLNVVQMIPDSAHVAAYERMRRVRPNGTLPLSAKRRAYGLPAAQTLDDLLEEQVLIDPNDHARTLIAMDPDMASAEPVSAAYVKSQYIEGDIGTVVLAQHLQELGPAQPESVSTQGWATLLPLNDSSGKPFKMKGSGDNQYCPDFNSSVDPLLGQSVTSLHPLVRNDPTLGMDVTGIAPPTSPSNEFSGKLWYRLDGTAGVPRKLMNRGVLSSADTVQFTIVDGAAGLKVGKPEVTENPEGSATVVLNNFSNWFLRYLGMYIQFTGPNGQVIPTSTLDRGQIFPGPSVPLSELDLEDNAFFGGLIAPPFTVLGIPVTPGTYSVTVNFPPEASELKIFFGTLGFNGSKIGPAQAEDLGLAISVAINYGMVAFFMGIGVSGVSATAKLLVGTLGQMLAQEILVTMSATLNGTTLDVFKVGLAFIKALVNGLAGKGLVKLVALIFAYVSEAIAEEMIPVVGIIARVVSAVVGAVKLAETTIEAALSPPVYEFDMVRSHDVSVTILPEGGAFPALPTGYTLYYKVNYLFDSASPHYLEAVTVPTPYPKSISFALKDLPQGGTLNVSVGFYAQKDGQAASMNDWCAAKGTTGPVENVSDTPRTITVQEFKIPIQKETVYTHKQVTRLDSGGKHFWRTTSKAPAYTPPTGGQEPGSLGALRSITVRQSTSTQSGYVGYAWQGYSSGLLDCSAGARGQLDQAANLNTDPSDAQSGFASTPCGQQGGASSGTKLTYSLLSDDSANFFLDTNSLYIRQVSLGNPPTFNNPSSGNAFGRLNLESTALLLHPTGHAISINNTNHKLEVLKLPLTAQSETVATNQYLARSVSGQGSRPGLITSPVAAAVSPEGVILVLEASSGNNRIQAFDLGGNPIQYFQDQAKPYFFELAATAGANYLDLAVEFSGFIYVLAQGSDGVFRLDIYHPGQSGTEPISTTYNVNGARLCVDFWRTVYTLNYQVLQLPNNGGFPALTEPSVSGWLPSLP